MQDADAGYSPLIFEFTPKVGYWLLVTGIRLNIENALQVRRGLNYEEMEFRGNFEL